MRVYTAWKAGTDLVDVWVYRDQVAPPLPLDTAEGQGRR